jgi:hypothetical protein
VEGKRGGGGGGKGVVWIVPVMESRACLCEGRPAVHFRILSDLEGEFFAELLQRMLLFNGGATIFEK